MACSSRPKGTRFIFEAGVKLGFCEQSTAMACVYYHKFYKVMKDEGYIESLVVMATLSLAAKANEVQVKLSDIVNTCYRCLHPGDESPLEVCDVYWELKDSVARYELLLLRALRFDIYIQMPHTHLRHYLLALSRWVDPVAWTRSHLPSISLSLLQDCYHTHLPLSLSQHKLATAVLYLAVACSRLTVPGNDSSGRKWWAVFCPGTSEEELQEICREVMAMYGRPLQLEGEGGGREGGGGVGNEGGGRGGEGGGRGGEGGGSEGGGRGGGVGNEGGGRDMGSEERREVVSEGGKKLEGGGRGSEGGGRGGEGGGRGGEGGGRGGEGEGRGGEGGGRGGEGGGRDMGSEERREVVSEGGEKLDGGGRQGSQNTAGKKTREPTVTSTDPTQVGK